LLDVGDIHVETHCNASQITENKWVVVDVWKIVGWWNVYVETPDLASLHGGERVWA
jgi:hypothetical protein